MAARAVLYFLANMVIIRRTHGGQEAVKQYPGRAGDFIGNVTVVQSYTRLMDEASAMRNLMAGLLRAQLSCHDLAPASLSVFLFTVNFATRGYLRLAARVQQVLIAVEAGPRVEHKPAAERL